MSLESGSTPSPQENPFANLAPQEANLAMQEIFKLRPVNAHRHVHNEDPELAERRIGSELCIAASAQLGSLLEVSGLTPTGQSEVVVDFQKGFARGQYIPEEDVLTIPDNSWDEDFGWSDPDGGVFGPNVRALETKMYRDSMALFLRVRNNAEKIIKAMLEDTRPEMQSLRERIISQRMLHDTFGEEKNPLAEKVSRWRSELIDKYNDEP